MGAPHTLPGRQPLDLADRELVQDLASHALELDPDHWHHQHTLAHLDLAHPQVRAWPDDNPYTAHELDHRDWIHDHTHPGLQRATAERNAEQAFDRLNPNFGVPADQHHPLGRQDVRDREAALALGTRVAIHDSRQNDRNPHVWQPGQDYRAAEAIQAARRQPARTRHGPEWGGPER
jgi:hypothetical protein